MVALSAAVAPVEAATFAPQIPRVWDEEALRDLELPLAGTGQRPKHVSPEYYYAQPVRPVYASYPVYHPDREPAGYFDQLQGKEPVILWDDRGVRPKLATEAAWVAAGELVFDAPIDYVEMTPTRRAERATNHKLVAVPGFVVPGDHPARADVSDRIVDTDPTLALQSRRGTGFYKVPSLRGLWYRGYFEHNGSCATLEDWFDPRRLEDNYVPTGWKGPPGTKTRAVRGHDFGLDLGADDRRALLAYLRTL